MKDEQYYAINYTTGEVIEYKVADDDIDGYDARAYVLDWVEIWLRAGDRVEVGKGDPWAKLKEGE